MKPVIRLLASAGLLALGAGGAHAQGAPSPYDAVPRDKAAVVEPGTDRVFGGREVQSGEFPFQVALLRADALSDDPESQFESQFCGGTLVAPTWVLTAAHCMMDYGEPISPDNILVLTGTVDLFGGQRVAAKSIVVNEQYDDFTMDHDVALVELAAPVDLPTVDLDLDGGSFDAATVIGWGMTEDGQYPRNLLESDIDVVGNAECNIGIKTIYAANIKSSLADLGAQYRIKDEDVARVGDEMAKGIADPLTDTMVCAGLKTGKRDSCYGDSGGPLVARRAGRAVQLGIVSWGEGPADADIKCGHEDVYGVYSRIASFRDWIVAHIGGPADTK